MIRLSVAFALIFPLALAATLLTTPAQAGPTLGADLDLGTSTANFKSAQLGGVLSARLRNRPVFGCDHPARARKALTRRLPA